MELKEKQKAGEKLKELRLKELMELKEWDRSGIWSQS